MGSEAVVGGVGAGRFSDRPGLARPGRVRALAAAALVHALLAWAILRGLAGGLMPLSDAVERPTLRVYNVLATPPPPPTRSSQAQAAAARAPAARRAQASAVVAPRHPVIIPPRVVTASVASLGVAPLSGAATVGAGSGASGAGQGTGAGGSGTGTGEGSAAKAVKLAGDINSTRDYPPDRGGKRLGSSVTVALTVQADGRVGQCRVLRPSVDPAADAVTCRLAIQRFRFRPATDSSGQAVESTYGWKQSWFRPGEPDKLNR